MSGTDHLAALDVATLEFGSRLALVQEGHWSAPTPCDEWDVRYLVAHVVGGNRFATAVLGGQSSAEAIEQVMSRTQLGDDPNHDLTTTVDRQRQAFRAKGRLDAGVDHPAGTITGREFLAFRIFDITLHAWDLATAIGSDPLLDRGLVEVVLEIVTTGPEGMGFGLTRLGEVADGAGDQAVLLDLTGRRSA